VHQGGDGIAKGHVCGSVPPLLLQNYALPPAELCQNYAPTPAELCPPLPPAELCPLSCKTMNYEEGGA